MEHYILIQWSDSQQVIEKAMVEGWEDECFLAVPENDKQKWVGNSAYFVPLRRIEQMERVNRENIAKHLLDYQLGLVGKVRVDMMNVEKWRFDWTLTRKQYESFRGYAIPLMRKVFKCNKSKAENSFDWWFQQFGLRLKG